MDWPSDLPALLGKRLFTIDGTVTTVGSALAIVAVVAAAYLVARAMRRLAARHYARHNVTDDIALKATAAILQIIVWLIALEVVLHLLGIRLTTLFAASGALALGAGFGIKNIVDNWLSGIILRLGQTIRPGDVIVLDEQWLHVKRIGPRTTDALSWNDEEIMIPNATVAQSMVTNLTRHDSLYRLRATVGVSYEADPDTVRRTLEATLNGLEWRSTKRDPLVYLTDFGPSAAQYTVYVWIDDARYAFKPSSDLREAVWQGLRAAGIGIAFPQLDVHLDSPTAAGLTEMGQGHA